uniref:BHLH domain-containing protein n=1 Tax=Caenorhabditis tropicalis TaxID=1561998 RepID=A0A1I7UL64_9PELO
MIICGSGSISEGRKRRREFKMKIYEAKRKAEGLIRGDRTISKLVVNVPPIQYINQRVEIFPLEISH